MRARKSHAFKLGFSTATLLLGVLVCFGGGRQHWREQADWSSGPGVTGPTIEWNASFAESTGVSWLAIPGQLTLASTPLDTPVPHPLDLHAPGAIKVFADDVDSDGDNDVLVAAYWEDTITLWHNLGGTPPQWRAEEIVSEFVHPVGLSTADVDGDGRPDIIASASDSGEVNWWRNLGGDPPGWARFDVSTETAGGHDVAGADLDSDGDTDLVVPACEDDELIWFRNDGGEPVQWTNFLIAGNWDYPCKVEIADVDADGDPDVVATAWTAEEIAWWRNDAGDPIRWTKFTITTGFTGTHWVDCADIDGDGRFDVLAAAMNRGEVAWWRNLGGNPVDWQRHTITSSLIGAVSLHPADMDGDGDIDVAASGWDPRGGVDWFENTEAGNTWQRHRIDPDFGETSSVHTADIDGDGDLDLLASSWSGGEVRWWELTEFGVHGSMTSSILDTGGTAEWQDWQALAEVPPGTALTVEARASDNPEALGPWNRLDPGAPSSALADGLRYFQYRVVLDGGPTTGSPLLHSIAFSWDSRAPQPRRPGRRLVPN